MALDLLRPISPYLPWWHNEFAPYSTGSSRPKIKSGCPIRDGNVACDPESMRASAERQLQQLGLWKGSLSLAAYTLARYASSEVGSGPPEEKAAVIELAINQAKKSGITVNQLLLYRQNPGHRNYGWYGPIHGPAGTATAPYGRWASTSSDPGVDDLLIAAFALVGGTANFTRGADDQLGMEYIGDPVASVKYNAAERDYWVGPIPGVDHWRLFMFSHRPDIDPNSTVGIALKERAVAAVSSRARPDWGSYPIARSAKLPAPVLIGIFLAAGMGLAYAVGTYVEPTWRGHRLVSYRGKIDWPFRLSARKAAV